MLSYSMQTCKRSAVKVGLKKYFRILSAAAISFFFLQFCPMQAHAQSIDVNLNDEVNGNHHHDDDHHHHDGHRGPQVLRAPQVPQVPQGL